MGNKIKEIKGRTTCQEVIDVSKDRKEAEENTKAEDIKSDDICCLHEVIE